MDTKLLDGQKFSEEIITNLKQKLLLLKNSIIPKLVVIIVGDDFASHVYVNHKAKACKKIGFLSEIIKMDENSTYNEILAIIEKLNNDQTVHGILLQIPLPKKLLSVQEKLLQAIAPYKDIDCFNFINFGKVAKNALQFIYPCTPNGIIRLLDRYNIEIISKNITIIGSSNIVGKPLALMLEALKATVTICNVFTQNLKQHTINADIIITATGKKDIITVDMVKPGVVIIDVGILRDNNKIRGDVDYKQFLLVCSYITPVPKGVGPVTIAMLMENLWILYENSLK